MQRKGHLGLAIVLLLTFVAPVQAATPKAGAKCTKAGTTATASGKKFTCIKSGTKLVWNKGVAIKIPSPVATLTPEPTPEPTPTPTPTPMPTPTPTSTPTIPSAPIVLTFDNILENYREITANVYAKYEAALDKSFQSKIEVKTIVGPNTKPILSTTAEAIGRGSNLLRNFKQPDVMNVIYYSFVDKEWAIQKTQEVDGTNRWNYQLVYECTSPTVCRGGSAGLSQKREGMSRFTVSQDNSPYMMSRRSTGWSEIHEFTHVMYMTQLKDYFCCWYQLTPSWFSEGHADVIGMLGGAKTLTEYVLAKDLTYKSVWPDQTLRSYSSENILRFYEALAKLQEPESPMKQYVYSLGYSTVEALVAIGGIESPMNLFLETTKGSTFEQAFKTIYGIEWKVAAPILAEVVSRQYSPFGWK
jgi:hypothetical protein